MRTKYDLSLRFRDIDIKEVIIDQHYNQKHFDVSDWIILELLKELLEYRRKNMGFPTDKELERMRNLLADAEGVTIVPKNGPKVERLKYEICQKLLKAFEESKMSQKEFAIFLSLDEALVSKILRSKIEAFTIDRLLKYLEVVRPDYEIKLG